MVYENCFDLISEHDGRAYVISLCSNNELFDTIKLLMSNNFNLKHEGYYEDNEGTRIQLIDGRNEKAYKLIMGNDISGWYFNGIEYHDNDFINTIVIRMCVTKSVS